MPTSFISNQAGPEIVGIFGETVVTPDPVPVKTVIEATVKPEPTKKADRISSNSSGFRFFHDFRNETKFRKCFRGKKFDCSNEKKRSSDMSKTPKQLL